jgi:hypothetical protein
VGWAGATLLQYAFEGVCLEGRHPRIKSVAFDNYNPLRKDKPFSDAFAGTREADAYPNLLSL